jgi:ABC-type xylose transport system substrate-binding protein
MVKQFEAAGYATDLQYAEDDIPNQLAQIENMITKEVDALVIARHRRHDALERAGQRRGSRYSGDRL